MDRYEIEKAMAAYYSTHPHNRDDLSVITVINPEELGSTTEEVQQTLGLLFFVGFYVVVPNQSSSQA